MKPLSRVLCTVLLCCGACDSSTTPDPDAGPAPCAGSGGDSDGDGICGDEDNCPLVFNIDQLDVDGDGVGDACDATPPSPTMPPCDARGGDLDGDDWCGVDDNCPNDANPGQEDGDGDGWGDLCDPEVCNDVDDDGDGRVDEGSVDRDGDGVADCADRCLDAPDRDSDGDGTVDCLDECPLDPLNDADGDRVCAPTDNCPERQNDGQSDRDGDGIGDSCDVEECDGLNNDLDREIDEGMPDEDGDGLCDAIDECLDDPINDPDGDGLCATDDNCQSVTNPAQSDVDGDGFGDACDLDFECGPSAPLSPPGSVPLPDEVVVANILAAPDGSLLFLGGLRDELAHRVVAVDGETRSIRWTLSVGNVPSVLAVSDDGSMLYVGSRHSSTVRAVDLVGRRACRSFVLDPLEVTYALSVPQGQPNTVVVGTTALAVYDAGSRRPMTIGGWVQSSNFPIVDGTDVFEAGFGRLVIERTGLREVWSSIPGSERDSLVYAGGRLYSSSGAIIEPATSPSVLGWLPSGPQLVVPSIQRAFTASYPEIVVTDLATLVEVRRERLSGSVDPRKIVRWGSDGVAVLGPQPRTDDDNNLLLMDGVVRP